MVFLHRAWVATGSLKALPAAVRLYAASLFALARVVRIDSFVFPMLRLMNEWRIEIKFPFSFVFLQS